MPKYITVTVNGVTYNSIHEAWRELAAADLDEITVRKRLDLGWTPEEAFFLPVVPAEKRRTNKQERVDTYNYAGKPDTEGGFTD